jgi:hypothetical protein
MNSRGRTWCRFVIHRLIITELLLMSAAVGVSFMQFANKNSMRNIYIIGLSLFLGISIPQYFSEYTSSADGRGPARTNAGWVFEASPFTYVTFSVCIVRITHLHVLNFSACHNSTLRVCNLMLQLCQLSGCILDSYDYARILTSKCLYAVQRHHKHCVCFRPDGGANCCFCPG